MENPSTPLPRVTIQFCTQCKWMLRAAYYAQELLSTFSTSLGEVALQPSTGGTFIVHLYHASPSASEDGPVNIQKHLLWDRKAEGGFPETKELKRGVRDIIDPNRDLGHVDGKKQSTQDQPQTSSATPSNTTPPEPSPLPKAVIRLQADAADPAGGGVAAGSGSKGDEGNYTPMDLDVQSRNVSASHGLRGSHETGGALGGLEAPSKEAGREKEVLNSRGKIVITGGEGESMGFCRPGEDCEDCA